MKMEDNWQNRSAGMRCKTCVYFVEKEQLSRNTTSNAMQGQADNCTPDKGSLGRCRRHAPTMNGFPAVFGKDWCGDHKMDENKI